MTLVGQAVIVQVQFLPAQTTAQIMVTVMRMEAVFVTLDGQVVVIVQLLHYAQTTAQAQIMVNVILMMEAVLVSLDGKVMIVQFLLYQLHKHIYKAPQTQINKH